MSQIVRIVIPGEPRAQKRPRATAFMVGRRLKASIYIDNEDIEWRKRAQVWILEGLLEAGMDEPGFVGPVAVRITSYFELPASHHRVREPLARQWKQTKPDGDNVEKAVLDACNGIAWVDDVQVAKMEWTRLMAAQGEEPRLEIEIEEISVDPSGKPLKHREPSLFAPATTLDDDAHTRALRDK